MSLASIIISLQMAAALLTGIQHNPQISATAQQRAIALSSQIVQQAVQAEVMPTISFPTPKNTSVWPNVEELRTAAYIGADGGYVPLGTNMVLVDSDTSFGDINGDGLDDAAAVVQRTNSKGNTTLALAVMLNQNGSMFNIADVDLGAAGSVQILSHHVIEGGNIVLNTQAGTAPAQTSTYELLGEELIKI